MPTGVYTVMDGEGRPVGREEFRCAPGPAGWRYFSTIQTELLGPHSEIVDLAVDAGWRPVRVRIDSGSHDLLLTAYDSMMRGARDGELVEMEWEDDVDYLSPCFNVATAKRLGQSAEIQTLFFEPVTLESSLERQRYELLGDEEVETPAGRYAATAWQYTALRTGFTRRFWLSADVLISYEGVFELASCEPGPGGPFPSRSAL